MKNLPKLLKNNFEKVQKAIFLTPRIVKNHHPKYNNLNQLTCAHRSFFNMLVGISENRLNIRLSQASFIFFFRTFQKVLAVSIGSHFICLTPPLPFFLLVFSPVYQLVIGRIFTFQFIQLYTTGNRTYHEYFRQFPEGQSVFFFTCLPSINWRIFALLTFYIIKGNSRTVLIQLIF